MSAERKVKIIRNGDQQAVQIPREFELPGQVATMSRKAGRLIIEPTVPKSLLAVLATLKPLDEDFAPMPDLVPEPIEL